MHRAWAIIERELRRFRRSPTLIVLSMILPIVQLCVLGYSEIRFSRNPNPKMWGGSNFDGTAAVTFDSLIGSRLTGKFSGTLTSQNNPPNPPVSINGTFSIDVGG